MIAGHTVGGNDTITYPFTNGFIEFFNYHIRKKSNLMCRNFRENTSEFDVLYKNYSFEINLPFKICLDEPDTGTNLNIVYQSDEVKAEKINQLKNEFKSVSKKYEVLDGKR